MLDDNEDVDVFNSQGNLHDYIHQQRVILIKTRISMTKTLL